MQAFAHGVLLALGLILPLGMQNLFVLNQGVNQERFSRTLPVVVTAALCDTLLIILAIQGTSLVIERFAGIRLGLLAAGVVFLIYMGWLSWHTAAGGSGADATAFSPRRQVLFAVTVSLFNPHAILDTVGVIGTSSVSYHGQDKLLFAAACVSVSWGWFLALAFIGWKTGRQKGFDKVAAVINKLSAGFMWLSAAVLVYSNL